MFEDFRQKKTMTKIRKMRADQKALPIYQFRDQIIAAVNEHQVVLVAGDTGCGKSTQVPQYLIQAGYTSVCCTQPRRISTISLCRRVATETLNEYGSQVAYQIRFESTRSERTKILFLTEGLLLRQVATDPLLEQYSVVIIDEVHERHLTGDFLLGILLDIVKQRPSLKVVLMSATINQHLFANYFGAFAIQVPGRLYPITLNYIPPEPPEGAEKSHPRGSAGAHPSNARETVSGLATARLPGAKPTPIEAGPYVRLLQRIEREYPTHERGDLLVFLSGINEIMTVAEKMREHASKSKKWIILLLHSSVPAEEQDKVFDIAPDGVRKCVLSTNIAETSVTIDGIRFVADSGKVKEMGYEAASGTHSLQEYWVSKASANQRKGRAGRTGPGVCFRLYSQEEYDGLLDFAVPEIKRVQIESTALQIKCMGHGDPRLFPFIEPPPQENMYNAMRMLRQLQCVSNDEDEDILPLGAVLSQLPVDLPMGKLLVLGTVFGLADELMTIAAAVSVQSPFQRIDQGSEAMKLREAFTSEEGDPFTLLNAYDEWIRIKAGRAEDGRKWCKRHGLEEQRLYEITRLKDQFGSLLKQAGLLREETVAQAKNRVARSNPDRSWKRKQLRRLQREREQNKRARILDVSEGVGGGGDAESEVVQGEGGEDGEGAGEGEQGQVDLKSLDFELSYDLKAMSDVSTRDLSVQQINIVKFALASSLYPNVAVADAANVNRRMNEAIFNTYKNPGVFMHPTSVYGAAPSLVGQADLLVYSQILETSKAYLMNATKAPLLATLLLVCSSIDLSRTSSKMLIDNWLEVGFKEGRAAEKMVFLSQQLRAMMRSCLSVRLATNASSLPARVSHTQDPFHSELPALLSQLGTVEWGGGSADDAELAAKLAEFLEADVKYTVRIPSRSTVLWMLLHPSVRGQGHSAAAVRAAQEDASSVVLSDGLLDMVKLQALKGGVFAAEGVRFGSLYEGPVQGGGFQCALGHHSTCSVCGVTMLATLEEFITHEETCQGKPKEEKQDIDLTGLLHVPGQVDVTQQQDTAAEDSKVTAPEKEQGGGSSVRFVFKKPSEALGTMGMEARSSLDDHPFVVSCVQAGALPLNIEDMADLQHLSSEVLKAACGALGLKAGGTHEQRSARLLNTLHKPRGEWDPTILAAARAEGGGGGKRAKKKG